MGSQLETHSPIYSSCIFFELMTQHLDGCAIDVLIDRDPQILGGTPEFAGTRVPVCVLLEHLESRGPAR